MSSIKFRPTFSLDTERSSADVFESIRNAIQAADSFEGQFREGHGMVSVIESKRHFWSPWLHLDFRASGSSKFLFGRFSPHPTVWTGFIFGYLSLGVILFFSLVLGLSQQLAHQWAWGYLVVPACLLIAGLMWLASQVGQKLAHDEMEAMHRLIIDAMNQ